MAQHPQKASLGFPVDSLVYCCLRFEGETLGLSVDFYTFLPQECWQEDVLQLSEASPVRSEETCLRRYFSPSRVARATKEQPGAQTGR